MKACIQQAEWALQYNCLLVLHTRNAMQETIDVIKEYKGKDLTGYFSLLWRNTAKCKRHNEFYLGIGGVVTYKNSGLAEVIKDIDLEHIVLETDAPYLTPCSISGVKEMKAVI